MKAPLIVQSGLEPLSGNITNLWKQMKEEGPSSSVLLPEDSTALSNLFKTAIYNSGKFQLPRRVLEAYLELQLPHYPALRDSEWTDCGLQLLLMLMVCFTIPLVYLHYHRVWLKKA